VPWLACLCIIAGKRIMRFPVNGLAAGQIILNIFVVYVGPMPQKDLLTLCYSDTEFKVTAPCKILSRAVVPLFQQKNNNY
jgi:hypothetical protein